MSKYRSMIMAFDEDVDTTNNAGNSNEEGGKEFVLSSDGLFHYILDFIVEQGPCGDAIHCWPWELHINTNSVQQISYLPREKINNCWKTYKVLGSVCRKWRSLVDIKVAKKRSTEIQRVIGDFQSGRQDCFEIIYQPPPGNDSPEGLDGQLPWQAIKSAQIPPQGLVFIRSNCRFNACSDYFYNRSNQIKEMRMAEGGSWRTYVPPHRIQSTGIVRVKNQFDDGPQLLVVQPRNGGGFCTAESLSGPWIDVETGEEIEGELKVGKGGLGKKLRLAYRQGPDICIDFLRKCVLVDEE